MTSRRRLWVCASALLVGCGGGSLSTTGLGATDGSSPDTAGVQSSLRVGLVGAWAFDGDGTDHSGNKLTLEITGLHFAAGQFGKGLQFAGEGTPIAQRPVDDPSLDLAAEDFTVSFWIDFAMTASAQFVAMKGYGDSGWFVGWARTAWAYGLPQGGTFAPPGGSPTRGTFHHVVYQRTGGTIELDVDSMSLGMAVAVAGAPSTKDPFQVGGYAPGGVTVAKGGSVVDGVVDDLAIWNRALTNDELKYLATHAAP